MKDSYTTIRCSKEMRRVINRMAKQDNKPMAEWVRKVVEGYMLRRLAREARERKETA